MKLIDYYVTEWAKRTFKLGLKNKVGVEPMLYKTHFCLKQTKLVLQVGSRSWKEVGKFSFLGKKLFYRIYSRTSQ